MEIRKETEKVLNQSNYILDLLVLVAVIKMCFRYTSQNVINQRYTMFMDDLVAWILGLTNTDT